MTGEAKDTISRGVLEPKSITRQAISGLQKQQLAFLESMMCRQMDAQIPDEVQERIQGFGAE